MLKQRIITGVILAIVTLLSVFFLPTMWFALLCAGVILIAAWEWGPLMGLNSTAGRIGFSVITGILMALLQWLAPVGQMWLADGSLQPLYQTLLMTGGGWWLIASFLVWSYPKSSSWQNNMVIKGAIGLLSLLPAWVAFIAIRTLNIDSQVYFGATMLLTSLVIVWAADVGAYFAGKKFGKHKLMPAVSPNKTIEGFVGGLVAVTLCAFMLNRSFGFTDAHWLTFLLVAVITAIVSAVGDLSESMLKRAAGIKDSGSILPGHGGLLDRIDSVVAATPVFILLYLFFLR